MRDRRGAVWMRAARGTLLVGLAAQLAASPGVAQDNAPRASLRVAAVILAEPAAATPFPIEAGPPGALPRNCFIRIKGMPAQATLSDGHSLAAGNWAVPLSGLKGLMLTALEATSGKSDLHIALVTIDGAVLAEARSTLLVANASLIAPAATVAVEPPSPSPPAAAAASPPSIAPETRERAAKLLQRGDAEMAAGDVAAARLFYRRAADAGLAEAALAMAQSFDPEELARRPVRGLLPDPAQARTWYERARVLGAAGAAEASKRLAAP